ncbi:putative Serine/threonine-protein kinase Chk2 [Paratrimastix pyriformis]|uniref:Serine/threonine-protein kinase Chk2 n=1 Tax=Paratrimastix pyriformis TaxID=342808 RepID=A0ABQ8UQF8_9EUKA|nr:putative Serine/threonine-protein kinase Chk2 [Paratrimastix pyriformis]
MEATQTDGPTQDFGEASDPSPSSPTKPKPWGKFVSLNPDFPHVELIERDITFGRRPDCTVVIEDMRISSKHCQLILEQDGSPGSQVFIRDLSWSDGSNGTFVNGKKLGRGNQTMLYNGDQVSLLKPPSGKSSTAPIAYFFNLLKTPKPKEEDTSGITQSYDIGEVLGSGNFSTVKIGLHRATGQKYAVKIIEKKKFWLQSGDRKDALMDEVRILKQVKHPNIINIREIFDSPSHLYLILELVTGGELFDRIVKGRFPEPYARKIFRQMLCAVMYLHSEGIVHRDLKPENILYATKDPDSPIKLSDFGVSRMVGEGSFMTTLCGTPEYIAPEIITSAASGYTKAVDLWSMGVILFILLSGYPPFSEESGPLFAQITNAKFSFPDEYWGSVSDDAKDLIRRLMTVDPARRISCEEVLGHPWVRAGEGDGLVFRIPGAGALALAPAQPLGLPLDWRPGGPSGARQRHRQRHQPDGVPRVGPQHGLQQPLGGRPRPAGPLERHHGRLQQLRPQHHPPAHSAPAGRAVSSAGMELEGPAARGPLDPTSSDPCMLAPAGLPAGGSVGLSPFDLAAIASVGGQLPLAAPMVLEDRPPPPPATQSQSQSQSALSVASANPTATAALLSPAEASLAPTRLPVVAPAALEGTASTGAGPAPAGRTTRSQDGAGAVRKLPTWASAKGAPKAASALPAKRSQKAAAEEPEEPEETQRERHPRAAHAKAPRRSRKEEESSQEEEDEEDEEDDDEESSSSSSPDDEDDEDASSRGEEDDSEGTPKKRRAPARRASKRAPAASPKKKKEKKAPVRKAATGSAKSKAKSSRSGRRSC